VEIPDNIKGNLDIRPVKWIDEVLGLALTQQPVAGQQAEAGTSPPPVAGEVPEDKRGRRNGRRVKQVPPPAH
jgi:ATP-dependent Lon protease